MSVTSRIVRRAQQHSASEVKDLLGALFAAELISPGRCIWIVSPWISDVEVVDNRGGGFEDLTSLGRRWITLAEVLVALARQGTAVVIGTTSDSHNPRFIARLEQLAADSRCVERIKVDIDESKLLHTKALTGDDYALIGSMNFTYNGIELREEHVELRTDVDYVAQARLEAFDRFGGVM